MTEPSAGSMRAAKGVMRIAGGHTFTMSGAARIIDQETFLADLIEALGVMLEYWPGSDDPFSVEAHRRGVIALAAAKRES